MVLYTFCPVNVKLVSVTLESVAVRILCEYPVNGSPPAGNWYAACMSQTMRCVKADLCVRRGMCEGVFVSGNSRVKEQLCERKLLCERVNVSKV